MNKILITSRCFRIYVNEQLCNFISLNEIQREFSLVPMPRDYLILKERLAVGYPSFLLKLKHGDIISLLKGQPKANPSQFNKDYVIFEVQYVETDQLKMESIMAFNPSEMNAIEITAKVRVINFSDESMDNLIKAFEELRIND